MEEEGKDIDLDQALIYLRHLKIQTINSIDVSCSKKSHTKNLIVITSIMQQQLPYFYKELIWFILSLHTEFYYN